MKRALLICYVNSYVGIGHLTRLLTLAKKLKKKIISEFLIFGNLIDRDDLNYFKIYNFSFQEKFIKTVKSVINKKYFDLIIFDIFPECKIDNLKSFFQELKNKNIFLISIDSLIKYSDFLNLIWVPSFNFDKSKIISSKCIVRSGWDTYLLQKKINP